MSTTRSVVAVRDNVSEEEWRTRVDLAAAYRLVALFGWDDLVFTHISAGVPGPDEHFLINPFGMLFDEITASSLVKVDLNGNIVMDSPYPISPAGFVIHSAIHAARESARCVLHTHTVNAIAVSAQKCGVLPISQQSAFILSSLGYHDYEGVAVRDDEKPRLVRDLGDNMFLMLRNHGLLTVGHSIADAFVNMYLFETVCRIQVLAQSCGEDLVFVDPRIIEGAKEAARKATTGMGAGTLNWPGLLRRLDRADDSYRD